MARTTGPPGWGVASKLFAVLDAFGADRPSLTLSEISQRTGIPLSTARRLIQELVVWGALERLPDGNYRIGMRLWEVGSLAPRQRGLRDAALPYMQDLYEAARQNVQLVVLDGVEALCVERIHGRRAVPTELDVGERLPLHATAAGKALLAFSSEDLLTRLREAGLTRFTPHTLDMEQLKVELRRARRTGVAYSSEERTPGAVGVASPILDRRRKVLGAVGIVAHAGTQMDRFGPAVRTAAITISRVLG
jgi:DNA-binding IclR family transcriptional regulator